MVPEPLRFVNKPIFLVKNRYICYSLQTMTMLESIVLGAVQGLTEFLPISSSGHLVLFQNLFGITEPELLFDTALHFGTLLALLAVFYKDVVELLRTFVSLLAPSRLSSLPQRFQEDEQARLLILILAGTVPTVVIGFAFKDFFERLFSSVGLVGCTLLATGTLLLLTRSFQNTSTRIGRMAVWQAVLIGLAQGCAITPGISRSGATIAVALFLGIERETSGRFSFLLSMPAILGAVILNFSTTAMPDHGAGAVAAGAAAAFITGYVSLVFLLRVIRRGKFFLFAPYCFLLGIAALIAAW